MAERRVGKVDFTSVGCAVEHRRRGVGGRSRTLSRRWSGLRHCSVPAAPPPVTLPVGFLLRLTERNHVRRAQRPTRRVSPSICMICRVSRSIYMICITPLILRLVSFVDAVLPFPANHRTRRECSRVRGVQLPGSSRALCKRRRFTAGQEQFEHS